MWVCKTNDQTITHIISECPKPLHKEYKQQHDWMGRTVHWDICRKKGFNVLKKWYEHRPIPLQKMSLLKFSGTLTFKRTA